MCWHRIVSVVIYSARVVMVLYLLIFLLDALSLWHHRLVAFKSYQTSFAVSAGYLYGLQYLQNSYMMLCLRDIIVEFLSQFSTSLAFCQATWCSVLCDIIVWVQKLPNISLGYSPGLPLELFSLLSLSTLPFYSHALSFIALPSSSRSRHSYAILALRPSLFLRHPCSYAILALTPSLLLRHSCSYALFALTPSSFLRDPCSYIILTISPSSLLRHSCSCVILAFSPSLLLCYSCF